MSSTTRSYQPRLAKYAKYNYPSAELIEDMHQHVITDLELSRLYQGSKTEREEIFSKRRESIRGYIDTKLADPEIIDRDIYTRERCHMAMDILVRKYFRKLILDDAVRIDGRKLDEIRSLYAQVGLLDQPHGSAIFRRGDTQILSTVTLGAPGDVQLVDDMMHDDFEKRFMHHYNFPPFSVNEAMKIRGTGNREIGHGRLAEKAIEYMIPSKQDFPYTIRIVSDCLSSGGSTSMGSVCGSTLSLMDAGVPIHKAISGIAMGMCTREIDIDMQDNLKNPTASPSGTYMEYQVLTDIQGAEDHHCDMDFKVAGSPDGITAIQLDMKIKGITVDMAMEVIRRGNTGRLEIMEYMMTVINAPRTDLSPNAPRITVIKIAAEKVKIVIGKGGETIDKIIAETGVKIDFEDDGTCMITSKDSAMVARTIEIIRGLTDEPEIGQIYTGEITRIESYGMFVKFMGSKQGLVGSRSFPAGITTGGFRIGQVVKIKLSKIDSQGRLELILA